MSDPLYWSAEYAEALVVALRKDPDFLKASRKFDGVIVLRCLGTPDGEDVEVGYRIQNGSVDATRRAEKSPSSAMRSEPFDKERAFARTTAPYSLWTKLDRGEINVLQAIASPDYAVEGPKLRITMNIGLFNAMSAVAAKMPKRYA